MKFEMVRGATRPPLRTVSEIAEVLNITQQALQVALRREDAPKPRIRGAELSHKKAGRVWYDPREVVIWFRALSPEDPEARKEKLREYYRNNAERILEQQRQYKQRCKQREASNDNAKPKG